MHQPDGTKPLHTARCVDMRSTSGVVTVHSFGSAEERETFIAGIRAANSGVVPPNLYCLPEQLQSVKNADRDYPTPVGMPTRMMHINRALGM